MLNHESLLSMIPYANFIVMTSVLHKNESVCILPAKKELYGQKVLPALHGGILSGFMEATATFL